MTRDEDFIGQLEGYLDEYEGQTPLPDAVRDAIRAELPNTKQIGPITGLMRDLSMNTTKSAPVRYGLVAAVAIAAVVLGAALFSRGPNVGGDQDSPTPSASPILIEPMGTGATNRLAAGRYYVDDPFPVRVSFELAPGWTASGYLSGGSFLLLSGDFNPSGELTIQVVDNVFVDPCDPDAGLREPPVGPSVDDLVSALGNLPSVEATAAVDVTVDGYAGKQLELTKAPSAAAACDPLTLWSTSAGDLRMGTEETFELLLFHVDGVRLVVAAGHNPRVSEEALAEQRAVVDSIQIP
jgi:hypothetical protein